MTCFWSAFTTGIEDNKENRNINDKKKLIKVIVPIFIVIVIAGIWILKNVSSGSADLVSPRNNEDFEAINNIFLLAMKIVEFIFYKMFISANIYMPIQKILVAIITFVK